MKLGVRPYCAPVFSAVAFALAVYACGGGNGHGVPPDDGGMAFIDSALGHTMDADTPDAFSSDGPRESWDASRDTSLDAGTTDAGVDWSDPSWWSGAPSSFSLPTRSVTFRVHVPSYTGTSRPVRVLIESAHEWNWVSHTPLSYVGSDTWVGTVAVEEGALLRYVYDRWDDSDWGSYQANREAAQVSLPIAYRYAIIAPGVTEVEDVVDTWRDDARSSPGGIVDGVVLDDATGEPVMDAEVSIAGLHGASDYDGRFVFEHVAVGTQRVVVHQTLGEHEAYESTVVVREGESSHVTIRLRPAALVRVRFLVQLPDDTPPDNGIFLSGSAYQLGARRTVGPDQPLSEALPVMERLDAHRATLAVDLREGSYVQYFYSLGRAWDGEVRSSGPRYRSFIVRAAEPIRLDQVEAFRPAGQVMLQLRVQTPEWTDPTLPLAIQTGPGWWLSQVSSHEWTTVFYSWPGFEQQYRYVMGLDGGGLDGTEALGIRGAYRHAPFLDHDTVERQIIERFAYARPLSAPNPDATANVQFRVTVPPETARDATVRLVSSSMAHPIVLTRYARNPWMFETSATIPVGSFDYTFDLGSPGTESTKSYHADVRYSGQVFDDWVTGWTGGASVERRPGFASGYYTPDYHSPNFPALFPSTYERARQHGGSYVAITSSWSYGSVDSPVIESRPIYAPSVFAQREELLSEAVTARAHGQAVLLAPQFNMEMSPGGMDLLVRSAHTRAWWDAWLHQAERMWMWHAVVAEEMHAEALVLPGPVFHVFFPNDWYENPDHMGDVDLAVQALIARVRSVYSGKLIMSGSVQGFDFPGLVDATGVTTFDLGAPPLASTSTVDQWEAAYEALFVEKVDPIRARWHKPVWFYTVHMPPDPDRDASVSEEELQANRLEAFFHCVLRRPWIESTWSWGYSVLDQPMQTSTDGIRARLGEAVFAKYYEAFAR